MNDTTVTIDLKKARIRIFKTTIHALGDPKHIQLLVNPVNKTVAIRSVEKEVSGDQAHRVKLVSGDSYEIYSRSFISKLWNRFFWKLYLLYTIISPAFTSEISLKIALPGIRAGPSAKSSERPCRSMVGVISG